MLSTISLASEADISLPIQRFLSLPQWLNVQVRRDTLFIGPLPISTKDIVSCRAEMENGWSPAKSGPQRGQSQGFSKSQSHCLANEGSMIQGKMNKHILLIHHLRHCVSMHKKVCVSVYSNKNHWQVGKM